MQKKLDDARTEQEANDMERVAELEEEHGFGRIRTIPFDGWEAGRGAATLVAVRIPLSSEKHFRRYQDTAAKAKDGQGRTAAVITLGASCLVYPDRNTEKELYDGTIELADGVIGHAGAVVIDVVQGNAAAEKKG